MAESRVGLMSVLESGAWPSGGFELSRLPPPSCPTPDLTDETQAKRPMLDSTIQRFVIAEGYTDSDDLFATWRTTGSSSE